MHSSFQSSTYNHALQTQILGPSSLKIFAGEDLSTILLMKRVEIVRGYNRFNQTYGGDSNRSRGRDERK